MEGVATSAGFHSSPNIANISAGSNVAWRAIAGSNYAYGTRTRPSTLVRRCRSPSSRLMHAVRGTSGSTLSIVARALGHAGKSSSGSDGALQNRQVSLQLVRADVALER